MGCAMARSKSQIAWLFMMGLFIAMLATCFATVGPVLADGGMPFGQGRLFEVSKDCAPTSYVFGKMHVTDVDVLRLPPPIARAFKSSRLLLVESEGDPAETYKIVEAMFFPKVRTLKDVLNPELYAEAVTAA